MSQIGGGSLNFRLAIGEMNFSQNCFVDELKNLFAEQTKVHFSYGKPKIQRTPSNLTHFPLKSTILIG